MSRHSSDDLLRWFEPSHTHTLTHPQRIVICYLFNICHYFILLFIHSFTLSYKTTLKITRKSILEIHICWIGFKKVESIRIVNKLSTFNIEMQNLHIKKSDQENYRQWRNILIHRHGILRTSVSDTTT